MSKKGFIEIVTENRIQLAITLASVAVTLIGAFIAIKLAPLQQNLAILKTEAQAREIRINDIENKCDSNIGDIKSELKYIRDRVDRIYDLTR